jgi:uncharacterized protein (DUF433 family)
MEERKLINRIERNHGIMFGKAIIKGTRLPVDLLLGKMAYGCSEDKILEEYCFTTRKDIRAALLYASRAISLEEEFSTILSEEPNKPKKREKPNKPNKRSKQS